MKYLFFAALTALWAFSPLWAQENAVGIAPVVGSVIEDYEARYYRLFTDEPHFDAAWVVQGERGDTLCIRNKTKDSVAVVCTAVPPDFLKKLRFWLEQSERYHNFGFNDRETMAETGAYLRRYISLSVFIPKERNVKIKSAFGAATGTFTSAVKEGVVFLSDEERNTISPLHTFVAYKDIASMRLSGISGESLAGKGALIGFLSGFLTVLTIAAIASAGDDYYNDDATQVYFEVALIMGGGGALYGLIIGSMFDSGGSGEMEINGNQTVYQAQLPALIGYSSHGEYLPPEIYRRLHQIDNR